VRFLDLCSGSGSVSDVFRLKGFEVYTCDPHFETDYRMTVQDLVKENIGYFDVIWGSPPCDEFALWGMPWYKEKRVIPDLTILMACLKIISKIKPKFWIIENVKGAKQFINPILGKPNKYGSRYLWGNMPMFDCDRSKCYGKEKIPGHCKNTKYLRSIIPREITINLAAACKREIQ
jgi:hypothetical protein